VAGAAAGLAVRASPPPVCTPLPFQVLSASPAATCIAFLTIVCVCLPSLLCPLLRCCCVHSVPHHCVCVFPPSSAHCCTVARHCARRACVELARTIYMQCIYGIFGRDITTYTVIYGVYIQFWPSLCMCFKCRGPCAPNITALAPNVAAPVCMHQMLRPCLPNVAAPVYVPNDSAPVCVHQMAQPLRVCIKCRGPCVYAPMEAGRRVFPVHAITMGTVLDGGFTPCFLVRGGAPWDSTLCHARHAEVE
jgi:hypothetical protein